MQCLVVVIRLCRGGMSAKLDSALSPEEHSELERQFKALNSELADSRNNKAALAKEN